MLNARSSAVGPSGTTPLLDAEGLSVDYPGPVRAVRRVSLSIARGETLALVGETGSGKSTLALSLAGLLGPEARFEADKVRFEGNELRRPGDWNGIRGRRLGFVFQNPLASLNPVLTVGAQLRHSLRAGGEHSRGAARVRSAELLDEVGLGSAGNLLDSYPFQLSGGMAQRVAIALGISNSPSLLIADEPTSALDPTVQRQILNLLLRLRERHGLALLLVTHDLSNVRSAADRVAVMYHGSIVEDGAGQEVLASPAHPYTRALVDCLPTGGSSESGLLPVIPGSPPAPGESPPGCSFAPRCDRATSRCLAREPVLREIGPARHVACTEFPGCAR